MTAHSLRKSLFLPLAVAILTFTMACGGGSNNTSSMSGGGNNSGTPPSQGGSNPPPGGGGGSGSSTNTYLYIGSPFSNDISGFKFNSDGTLTSIPGSPFSGGFRAAKSGNFLLVTGGNRVTSYSVNSSSGALTATGTTSLSFNADSIAADTANAYIGSPNGIWGYTVSTGQLTQVPGSPFQASSGGFTSQVDFTHLWLQGSYLFAAGDAFDHTPVLDVLLRASDGKLTKTSSGNSGGTQGPRIVVHASGKFVYALDGSDSGIQSYSFDQSSGKLTLLKTIQEGGGTGFAIDPAGKYLFVSDFPKGVAAVRVFNIDQGSGNLTEVPGSPFSASPNAALGVDPSGQFLILAGGPPPSNVTVFNVNPATGALTPTGKTYSAGNQPQEMVIGNF